MFENSPYDFEKMGITDEALRRVLTTLSDRENLAMRMRFGMNDGVPKTLDEIGKELGVTRERIRQIESKFMAKLRHPRRSELNDPTQ